MQDEFTKKIECPVFRSEAKWTAGINVGVAAIYQGVRLGMATWTQNIQFKALGVLTFSWLLAAH